MLIELPLALCVLMSWWPKLVKQPSLNQMEESTRGHEYQEAWFTGGHQSDSLPHLLKELRALHFPLISQLDFLRQDSKSDPVSSLMFSHELSTLDRLDFLGSQILRLDRILKFTRCARAHTHARLSPISETSLCVFVFFCAFKTSAFYFLYAAPRLIPLTTLLFKETLHAQVF